jgi:hypothetical protein
MKYISATLLVTIASLMVSGSAISRTPGLLGLKTPTGNIQRMIDDYGLADGSFRRSPLRYAGNDKSRPTETGYM